MLFILTLFVLIKILILIWNNLILKSCDVVTNICWSISLEQKIAVSTHTLSDNKTIMQETYWIFASSSFTLNCFFVSKVNERCPNMYVGTMYRHLPVMEPCQSNIAYILPLRDKQRSWKRQKQKKNVYQISSAMKTLLLCMYN
jgi:hypothetical protein